MDWNVDDLDGVDFAEQVMDHGDYAYRMAMEEQRNELAEYEDSLEGDDLLRYHGLI